MEDEGDYEVDYEVDDTEEFPATVHMKQDLEPEPEPEPEPQLEQLEQEPGGNAELEVDISDQLDELELDEPKKKRHGSFWKKPPTFVYASNFGFGVNSYQTMIDYLDAKDAGHRVNKDDVHLPLLEERCLRQYDADRPFRWYDNHDIDQYIMKGEKIRTQIRQNDAVGAGAVLRRTHTNWSMTRKWMQLLKKSNVLDYRESHKDPLELDARTYRPQTPVGRHLYTSHTTPTLDYPSSALKPKARYVEDLVAGFASALLSLVQGGMEPDYVPAPRSSRVRDMDDRFNDTLGEIHSLMGNLGRRPEPPQPVRQLDLSDLDMGAKNKIRRAEELRDMMDYVNELTSHNSARNSVRDTLRAGHMDKEMLALNHRIEDMNNLQRAERMKDASSNLEIDMLRAQIAARRNMTDPTSALLASKSYRLPSHAPPTQPVLLSAVDYLDTKPRESFVTDNVISDVSARVLKRAGEYGDPSSEQRRIRDRARFVNLTRRHPETGDTDLMGTRSRTERNIDHMAKTLASQGTYQRRYDVDDELDMPYLGPFTTTPIERPDNSPKRFLHRQPSPSRMVRTAASRALTRNSLLGY